MQAFLDNRHQHAGTTDTMPVSWTVGLVTEFADDTAVPDVTYSYRVTAIDALGKPGTRRAYQRPQR